MDDKLQKALAESKQGRESLIPLLQTVQERLGYISEEAVFGISERLGIPASEVFGVLTFYAQFRLTPVGHNLIHVCRGTACHVRGGAQVLRALESLLGVSAGETTPDMEYTLETVACIGACALAPTIVVNGSTYGQMNPQKVEQVFGHYRPEQSKGRGANG